jgi:hypothetical protein
MQVTINELTPQAYREQRKEQNRNAKDDFLARLKPGVILVSSWGYEQTNVDFYRVASVKKSTVTLEQLTNKVVSSDAWSSGRVIPGDDIKAITKHIVRSACIRINSYKALYNIWDGKPEHFSSYH